MSKILVIDDRKGNLTAIRAILEDAIPGCQVIEATSGKEGIELAKTELPDVILLDVVMPGMDGYEACKRLKTNDKTRHIHVILISTYQTDSKYKVQGFSAGADAFLIRPIERAELAAQISSMLRISRTEQQLKEALHKATESDRLKSAFLATMSHEFRTPLNAIIGFSGLVNEETSLEEITKYGRIIHDNGNILLQLVEDLFEVSLIETGAIKIKTEPVEIHPILFEMMQVAKKEKLRLGKEHIDLKLVPDMAASELALTSDPSRIKQILTNLVNNAVKFTPGGSVEIGCKSDSWAGKQFVTFYVKDTGIGISKEHRKIVFELFRQVDDTYSRPFQGAGIGLYISKRLSELLGGELWVESNEGEGSSFFFTLPLKFGSGSRKSETENSRDSRDSQRKVS